MSDHVLIKVRTPAGTSELRVLELLEVNGQAYMVNEDVPPSARLQSLEDRVVILEATLAALLITD